MSTHSDLEKALKEAVTVNKNPDFYQLAVGGKVIYNEEVMEIAKAFSNKNIDHYLLNTRDNKQVCVPVYATKPYTTQVAGLKLGDVLDAMHIMTTVTLRAVNKHGFVVDKDIIKCLVDDIPENALIVTSEVSSIQPEDFGEVTIDYYV
ncbi:hypothetical protein [Enterococcus phage EFLK1]|uniref:Uncharacterized protein n=1 Tax=Enterococcus phage EFLK1 TaxID=1640885 RepID=A0A0E3XD94_9CAUD|nr:hypothetical protein AVT53_gp130 [Enterococcus phage EFLK1]AKC05049.1 hypothetical protein [Enterococcus phage EFLK1]